MALPSLKKDTQQSFHLSWSLPPEESQTGADFRLGVVGPFQEEVTTLLPFFPRVETPLEMLLVTHLSTNDLFSFLKDKILFVQQDLIFPIRESL